MTPDPAIRHRAWLAAAALATLAWLAPAAPAAAQNPCNPCAANPCAGNPCNPCGGNPCNPCGGGAAVDPARFQQPPSAVVAEPTPELEARGEALWNDKSLSRNGLACATCHVGGYAQMNATFAKPFPHRVNMPAQMAGVEQVNAAEMVNFCMLQPMQAEPLGWDTSELAALAAYVEKIQKGYDPGQAAANPCAANPCNPCGANPCNPCGGG